MLLVSILDFGNEKLVFKQIQKIVAILVPLVDLLLDPLWHDNNPCTEDVVVGGRITFCTELSGGQSGLINVSGTGTIFDAATNGLPCRI